MLVMLTSLPLTHTRRLSRSISRPRTFKISGRGFSRLPTRRWYRWMWPFTRATSSLGEKGLVM